MAFVGVEEGRGRDSYAGETEAPDVEAGDYCCYDSVVYHESVCGRPLVIDGLARQAEPTDAEGWSDATDGDAHPAAAAVWLKDALAEHASIAAFADLALHLLHHGAPAWLVADVQAALADEVRHAEAAFSLASRLGGRRVGPGRLDVPARPALSLMELVVETARDGIVGETVAAAVAAARLSGATDPQVRAALSAVVAEEARHAALAWQIVDWAVSVGGADVAAAAEQVIAEALARPVAWSDEATVPSLGLCGPARLAAARRAALRWLGDEVVAGERSIAV